MKLVKITAIYTDEYTIDIDDPYYGYDNTTTLSEILLEEKAVRLYDWNMENDNWDVTAEFIEPVE